ncbi:NUDIX hydrolase [Pseudomonas mangiferae]|uniref:NUDIX domain-containing protein n=1 Tax=Pseudomonas mangiferae TaxID=2593654 RepID=A0A553GUM9_9PSED|nr:NUDIX domain-containing protein [Pseudomonas mangiferae]TRX73214.1 NUDIX domain-containing protein [Pseudomonas mangiferae]
MPVQLSIAAACLRDAQGRLLLVRKRGTRFFMLPGGKREPGETSLAALTRELWEELELRLPPEALTPLGRFQARAANEADTWIDADLYTARLDDAVTPQAELEALHWWHPGTPADVPLAPLLKDEILRQRLRDDL